MEKRRRAPRVSTTSWFGRYVVENEPGSGWEECMVIDISILGLGLELFGTVTEDMIGKRLVVHVGAPAGESVSLRLVGQLKNLSEGRLGGIRAGLEFVDLSETEREILKAMELLKVAW